MSSLKQNAAAENQKSSIGKTILWFTYRIHTKHTLDTLIIKLKSRYLNFKDM